MYQMRKQKPVAVRALVALLSVALVFTMMPLTGSGAVHAAGSLQVQTPVVAVTGTGILGGSEYNEENVSAECSYTLQELKAMQQPGEITYTSKKQRDPFKKEYHKVRGVSLSSLVSDPEKRTERITIIANDGYVTSFRKGTAYHNVPEEVGGQGSIGSSLDYSKLEKILPAPGLDQTRCAFEDFDAAKGKPVPVLLAWNYESSAVDVPASAGTKDSNLKLYVGQLSGAGYDGPEDMNGPLLNGGSSAAVRQILVGEHIDETALTIGEEGFTRADLLLKPRAERLYEYTSQKGDMKDYVRGVPMSVLLDGYSDSDVVSFTTADDYPVAASGYTVKDLVDNDYMLGYAMGSSAADLTGIYDQDKAGTKHGFLRLYGGDSNGKPAKMINGITITSGGGINFATSEYKHITNGGIKGQTGPYNIDAITGATLTVEGPGTEASVPLSVKDMEGRNAGCSRGVYTDTRDGKKTKRTYEGVDLYYLLHDMSDGDNGIRLTKEAKQVKIKNRNRKTIAELSLKDIKKMHQDGRPAIVAYGTAFEDGSGARPFVFDGGTGASSSLGNEDGCLKFVYDREKYGGNKAYTRFGNMAYIYVELAKAPGFKHNKSPYNTAANSQYVLTVTGDALGREINYKVKDIEKLVEYDARGNVKDNGYGWRSEYSLANSSYWYVNTYEGVKLWSLLRHSGISSAKAGDSKTKVTFRSTDNYGGFDVFSLKQIAHPKSFGFYEKNANDNNDGTYKPNEHLRIGNDVTTGDKLSVGYPVLVAYGVNEYPYVIDKSLKGFKSGLSNDGGPLRIISGKMNYNHANGSNQAKLLDRIVVGTEKYHYSTHAYQPAKAPYRALRNKKLTVIIRNGDRKTKKTFRVRDLEKLLYGGKLSAAQLKEARVKEFYETGKKGAYRSDLYEGVDLKYFIRDVLQLQGSQGKITFRSGKKKLTLDLKTVLNLKNGYNRKTKVSGLTGTIAFAKNGYPLVKGVRSKGYKKRDKLTRLKKNSKEAGSYVVMNDGGPLQVVFPRKSSKSSKTMGSLSGVTSIEIELKADSYAHVTRPYDKLGSNKLTVSGKGTWISSKKRFTVYKLEGKQSLITTKDYSIRNKKGKRTQVRYRGLRLYDFLKSTDVGLKTSADKVRVYTAGRSKPYEFALSDIMKTSYRNTVTGKKNLPVMLAFGSSSVKIKSKKDGKPLVASSKSKGYKKKYGNSGGPLKLVVGQTSKMDVNSTKILGRVVRIEVTAGEQVSWNHSSSEVFKTYLNEKLQLSVVGSDGSSRTKTLTVAQLEGMKDLITQQKIYAVKENTWEGLNFWKLIQSQFAGVPGIEDPVTITVKARDGYSVDAVEKAGLDGLKNGIKDGDDRVPVLLAYGMDGYPLAAGGKTTPTGAGYDSTVDNKGGPLRLMVHNAQGACIMEVTSITVNVSGSVPKARARAGQILKEILPVDETYAASKAGGFTIYEGSGEQGQLPLAGIRSVARDPQGILWIGTNGGGVASKAAGSEQFMTINSATEPALAGTVAYAVCPDRAGGVWISQGSNSYGSQDAPASGGAAYLKDGAITYYTAADGTVADDFVQEIREDAEGSIWFGTARGLTKYDPMTQKWTSWGKKAGDGIRAVDFPAESVDNIEIDGQGNLWCGFYPDTNADGSYTGGFACFRDGKVIRSYAYTSRKDANTDYYRMGDVWVRDIAVDSGGAAWAVASGSYKGMENAGGSLWYVSKPGAKAKQYTGFGLVGDRYLKGQGQQTNPELRMVAFDPRGGLWFGTSADGLLYIASPKITSGQLEVTAQFSSGQGSMPASFDSIYSLDFFGNTLYAGTNNGLAVRDFSKGWPKAVNPLKGVRPVWRSVKAGKRSITLRWKKVRSANGYIIYRATKKNGKYKKIRTIKSAKTLKYTASKLKKGKRYYFKIRAYRNVSGKKKYSAYSGIRSAKIRKR